MSRAMNNMHLIDRTDSMSFTEKCVRTPVHVEVLLDILRRPRFSGTEGESYVIDKYIKTIPGVTMDAYGNLWHVIKDAEGNRPVTMFSSHTDTVHKQKATGTYKLVSKRAWVKAKGGGVLGADCGTGIWLMLNLIKAKVPGLYVFHRDEEIGGRGSSFIADKHADMLTGIKHCIAFDRKSTSHVITHQSGGRCCSDTFANALAAALNEGSGMQFGPNDGGSFTDSANYTHIIPECTNLSVGYYDQHTQQECQDVSFATALANKLIAIDYSKLPAERDPSVEEEDDYEDLWAAYYRNQGITPRRQTQRSSTNYNQGLYPGTMQGLVENYPEVITDMLTNDGWTKQDLASYIALAYDVNPDEL